MSRERPILFNGAMVRAILEDRKTQTRRLVKPDLANAFDPPRGPQDVADGYPWFEDEHGDWHKAVDCCPLGKPGDKLWVRETWAVAHKFDGTPPRFIDLGDGDTVHHMATWDGPCGLIKRPSIHMPRWASRLTLEITEVRVQRLQEISCADAIAEGISPLEDFPITGATPDPREGFRHLWDSINYARAPWPSNPWIWAISFKIA